MTKKELIQKLDKLQTAILKLEEGDEVRKYLTAKEEMDAIAKALREDAVANGGFQTGFFQFQRIEQERTDWKGLCRKLAEDGRIDESDVMPFSSSSVCGKMIRMKPDTSIKIEA